MVRVIIREYFTVYSIFISQFPDFSMYRLGNL